MRLFQHSLGLLPLLLLGLFAGTLFQACTTRSMLQVDGRYEKARLPNHFDRDSERDANVVSATAFKTRKEWVAWQEGGVRGAHYGYSNASYGVDLSFLSEREAVFFGGYLGLSPEPGNSRFGGFGGVSGKSGILVGTLSLGMGVSINPVKARYEDVEYLFFIPVSAVEDSVNGTSSSAEIPFRAGLLFDLGPVSPYVSASFNIMGIGFEGEKQNLASGEAGLGLEYRLSRDVRIRAEATAANTSIDDHWTGPKYGARFDLARAF